MEKFIYVLSEKERDKLLSWEYTLLKSDERNHIYIFANQDSLYFDKMDVTPIYSNTLTF